MQSHYHVFSLPENLLEALQPRTLLSRVPSRPQSPTVVQPSNISSNTRTCNICSGAIFPDVDEQRAHFRSDWHTYNVKIRLKGGHPVSEADFAQLVDGLEESLSGSASSDEGSSGESDAVDTLISKNRESNRSASPSYVQHQTPQSALAWFHSPPSTQIGIYRAIFPFQTPPASYLQELRNLQSPVEEGRSWAMFMVAGGHFAGAVVRVSRPTEEDDTQDQSKARKKPPKPKLDTEVLKHKTFHRYTTRRKQGGSQSLNDNAKGNAKSAGALLRRYGEQALRDDIRSLLQDWAEDIDDCERIWIRASGSNRRIFLDYEGSVIQKGDERLRTFPFPTRRPTQSELARCLLELTRAKISHLTEEELRAEDDAYLASLPKLKPPPAAVPIPEPEKPRGPRLTKEEESSREKWQRLLEMVVKGRLEPLKSFWEREGSNVGGSSGIDVLIPEWTGEHRVTLLQLAAHSGQEDVTRWLLEDMHANPEIVVPLGSSAISGNDDAAHNSDDSDAPERLASGSRRTAYGLASTKNVRNVFRRCAASHPDWWDWFGAARVPSALSKDMEDVREERKKVRRKGLKEKIREREIKARGKVESQPIAKEEPAQAPVQHNVPMSSQRLGGLSGAAEGVAGLTPEMRVIVERERRARAAEARLKLLNGHR